MAHFPIDFDTQASFCTNPVKRLNRCFCILTLLKVRHLTLLDSGICFNNFKLCSLAQSQAIHCFEPKKALNFGEGEVKLKKKEARNFCLICFNIFVFLFIYSL